jgi:hypothetical protein
MDISNEEININKYSYYEKKTHYTLMMFSIYFNLLVNYNN